MPRRLLRLFPSLLLAAPLILLGLLAACQSDPPAAELACICGTPEADLHGCPHEDCIEGRTNPDNPDCVCGTLSIPKSK